MSSPDRTPIIVGVADFRNKSLDIKDAVEPSELMFRAVIGALADTELTPQIQKELLELTDSISVVPPWTWNYPDLPTTLSERLGINASHKNIGEHGGNQPVLLTDVAARSISTGETNAAIVVGAEALASRRFYETPFPRSRTYTYTDLSRCVPKGWPDATSELDKAGHDSQSS
jgi:hypothetical protein